MGDFFDRAEVHFYEDGPKFDCSGDSILFKRELNTVVLELKYLENKRDAGN